MKKIYKVIWILILTLTYSWVGAQNYLDDGSFESFSCPNICGSNAGITFDGGACSNNWYRSHGSPTINNSSGNGANYSNKYAFTWHHNSGYGEGIYSNLNQTMYSGDTYNITVWGKNNTSSSNSNFALIRASSSLTSRTGCSYGKPIPTTNAEIIQNITLNGIVNNWYLFLNVHPYTPTNDYDQLWLYPYTTSSTQLNVLWDEIAICASIRKLKTTARLNELESISVSDHIEVGGIAPVILNGTTNSELVAGNYILFTPNTTITPTSSSDLWAHIKYADCGSIAHRPSVNTSGTTDPLVDGVDLNNNVTLAKDHFGSNTIYPNPNSSGIFNITAENGMEIEVMDMLGKQIIQKTMNSTNEVINISDQPKGVYYIKLTNGETIEMKKIIYQ